MSKRSDFAREFSAVGGLASLALFVLSAGTAQAIPLDGFGGQTRSTTYDCPSYCTSVQYGPFDGGVGSTQSESSIIDSRGSAHSFFSTETTSGIDMPVLKAEAYSLNSGVGSAYSEAFGVDGYTYNGPEATKTFNLDISLSGTVSDATPLDRDTYIEANIYVFSATNFVYTTDISTLKFEYGAAEIASTMLRIDGNQTNVLLESVFTFDLAQGQSVYLVAKLRAQAQREMSYADAFSTLGFEFQDNDGLASAIGSVPEPSSVLLVGAGLLALGGSRRTRPNHT